MSPEMALTQTGVQSLETLREECGHHGPLFAAHRSLPRRQSESMMLRLRRQSPSMFFQNASFTILTNPQNPSTDWQVRKLRSDLRLSTQPSVAHRDAHALRGFVSLIESPK